MQIYPTREEIAYIAGFIDGDGSIWTHLNHGRNVQPRVTAYQNYKEPIDMIRKFYGGHLSQSKGYWQLQITKYGDVRRLLEDLSPYLMVKSKQATIALIILGYKQRWADEHGKRGVNSPYRDREFELAKELSALQSYPKRNGAYKKIYSTNV